MRKIEKRMFYLQCYCSNICSLLVAVIMYLFKKYFHHTVYKKRNNVFTIVYVVIIK